MSKAQDLLNKLEGKQAPVRESTVAITKRFRPAAPAKNLAEAGEFEKIIQGVSDVVSAYSDQGSVSELKAAVLSALKGQAAPKVEAKPKTRYRYEIPGEKIPGVAESLRVRLGERVLVEEKEDAVEVLSAEDVEDIVMDVLKAVGLVDTDDEEDDDQEDSDIKDAEVVEAAPTRTFTKRAAAPQPAPANQKPNPFRTINIDSEEDLEEMRNDTGRMSSFMKNLMS